VTHGCKVHFVTAAAPAFQQKNACCQARHEKHLRRSILSSGLLILDEICYPSLRKEPPDSFFQCWLAKPWQRSPILNSNLPFADWEEIPDGNAASTCTTRTRC
jgi:DNA replication protein DnaC